MRSYLLLFFFFLLALVQARFQQDYIQNDMGVTAVSVSYLLGNHSLYDVKMLYDNVYDLFYGGTRDYWVVPIPFEPDVNYWYQYLQPSGPLGVLGPQGPTGPLSSWGPIGENILNASYTGSHADCKYCNYLENYVIEIWKDFPGVSVFGPNGPLGSKGPLTGPEYYLTMYHLNQLELANNFPHNLDAMGVWGILGPLGPLGALGPLGPLGVLGPMTEMGTLVNPKTGKVDGSFFNQTTGKVIRTVEILFETHPDVYREYDLHEFYTLEKAQSMKDNDCSFSVEGQLDQTKLSASFEFSSEHSQTIAVLVVPLINKIGDLTASFSDFDLDLSIVSSNATYSFSSHSRSSMNRESPYTGYIDSIIARASPGDRLTATVSALSSRLDPVDNSYRLFVVGSGFLQGKTAPLPDYDLFNHLNIYGDHILFQ